MYKEPAPTQKDSTMQHMPVEGNLGPRKETEASTEVDEHIQLDPSPKSKAEGATPTREEPMDPSAHDSTSLHQILNYNFPSPPHEHIMYSSLAEVGIFNELVRRKCPQLKQNDQITTRKQKKKMSKYAMTN